MNEVKRYHVQLYKLAEDQQKYAHGALGAVEIVRASDFDRVTAENSGLQALLTAADVLADHNARVSAIAVEDVLLLQKRVDVLEGLLRDASDMLVRTSYRNTERLRRIDRALKQAEGGGDD